MGAYDRLVCFVGFVAETLNIFWKGLSYLL